MSEEGSLFHSLMVLWRIFTLRFKPNLGELLGPLIHAEEIAQIILGIAMLISFLFPF